MHKFARHLRPLIVAVALLSPTGSQANISMGMGLGISDLGGPLKNIPSTPSALLIQTGSKFLIQTGSVLLIHS